MSKQSLIVFLFCGVVSASQVVIANPTPLGSSGNSLVPYSLKREQGISIAEENLTIIDGETGSIPSFSPGGSPIQIPCYMYKVRYRFDNKSVKKTVKVGFPVITYGLRAGGSFGGFIDLAATYNGHKVEVQESRIPKPSFFPKSDLVDVQRSLQNLGLAQPVAECPEFVDLGKMPATLKGLETNLQKEKALSQAFKRNAVQKLKRERYVDNDEQVVGQELLWYTFSLPLEHGLSEELSIEYKSFAPLTKDSIFYILSTAKFWGDPISKIRIEILPDKKFVSEGGSYKVLCSPKFSIKNSAEKIVLDARNLVPDSELQIKRICGVRN